MRLIRAFPTDELLVRGDGRTICGIAVPFGQPTEIVEFGDRYLEEFAPGAFTRTIAERGPERVKVLAQHSRGTLPVGRASTLREDATGLYCELRVSRTRDGDDVLELVRDGALDALSIGFEPVRDRSRGDIRVRTEVKLREISVVCWPAYAGARIGALRSAGGPRHVDYARLRTAALRARYKEFL